jgi:hypothetical protein
VAANETPLQNIVTDDTVAHSVAVDAGSGALAVPVKGKGIQVYNLGASKVGGETSARGTASSGSTNATSGGSLAVNGLAFLVAGSMWAVLL